MGPIPPCVLFYWIFSGKTVYGQVMSSVKGPLAEAACPSPTSWISISVAPLGFEERTPTIPLLINTLLHNQHRCVPAAQFVFNGDMEFSSRISMLFFSLTHAGFFYWATSGWQQWCNRSPIFYPVHIDYRQVTHKIWAEYVGCIVQYAWFSLIDRGYHQHSSKNHNALESVQHQEGSKKESI